MPYDTTNNHLSLQAAQIVAAVPPSSLEDRISFHLGQNLGVSALPFSAPTVKADLGLAL